MFCFCGERRSPRHLFFTLVPSINTKHAQECEDTVSFDTNNRNLERCGLVVHSHPIYWVDVGPTIVTDNAPPKHLAPCVRLIAVGYKGQANFPSATWKARGSSWMGNYIMCTGDIDVHTISVKSQQSTTTTWVSGRVPSAAWTELLTATVDIRRRAKTAPIALAFRCPAGALGAFWTGHSLFHVTRDQQKEVGRNQKTWFGLDPQDRSDELGL